ncbi:MAG: HEPN domain-containing protein [Corynebacterium sp.]|uniref:HEPN domain-containing protein n=1 Tax=Corynebacterium casei TaxID=160386 RepID=UPI003F991EA1
MVYGKPLVTLGQVEWAGFVGPFDLRVFQSKPSPLQKHQAKRKNIISLLESIAVSEPVGDQLSRADLRFIKKNFNTKPIGGLGEALKFYFEDIPEKIWQELREFEAVKTELNNGETGTSISQIAGALTKIRNALSHGRKSYKVEDLAQIATILDRIVRYEFLLTVGVSQEISEQIFEYP